MPAPRAPAPCRPSAPPCRPLPARTVRRWLAHAAREAATQLQAIGARSRPSTGRPRLHQPVAPPQPSHTHAAQATPQRSTAWASSTPIQAGTARPAPRTCATVLTITEGRIRLRAQQTVGERVEHDPVVDPGTVAPSTNGLSAGLFWRGFHRAGVSTLTVVSTRDWRRRSGPACLTCVRQAGESRCPVTGGRGSAGPVSASPRRGRGRGCGRRCWRPGRPGPGRRRGGR